MKLTERRVGEALVIDIDGPSETRSTLMDRVEELLDDGERRIVLHLRAHSLDSGVLGQATACWLKTNRRGGVLKIASRQPKVWDLIRMLRLDRVLDCYRSEEEAIESFVSAKSAR
jgi:anti-anti-sigma regulatory factor